MYFEEKGKKSKAELLLAIDECSSISEIFELVRDEQIDIRMQTLCSASCIPPKVLTFDSTVQENPLQKLKDLVCLAIEHTKQ